MANDDGYLVEDTVKCNECGSRIRALNGACSAPSRVTNALVLAHR